jgi:L-ribulose-5-phosphate 3-epimerase
MLLSINAWTFPPGTDPRALAQAAAQAGFEAVELTMGLQGSLTTRTSEGECSQIARIFQDAGLKIASLATDLFWQCNYGDADPHVHRQAGELTQAGLDRAAWLGTDALLVVPAVVGIWNEPAPRTSYADALERTFDMLAKLREHAEDRGVHIAIENAPNRFLLSPVEMRNLIDRVNSPWVGAYFDVGNAMAVGYPQDWIDVLGRRIVRVHAKDCDLNRPGPQGSACPLREGSANWPAVVAALQVAGYDGPLTYEGPGDPAEIARRLRRVLRRS